MKRLLVTLALALIAVPSFAAIQYEFMLKNTSDDAAKPSSDMTGRATIDGFRSRVEFISGTLYPPNTYVIAPDSTGRLYFVDPGKQWFTEVNTAGIATALGASGIKIENIKSNVEVLPDRSRIVGIDTEHYRITISYDITVLMKTIPVKQHVETEIDSWTTTKFGDVPPSFLTGGSSRTGNAELDRLLDTHNAKISGFPLRQLVTTRTKYDMPARSKLERPGLRTMTRETWVTKIQEVKAEPSQFTIPVSYRRADQPDLPRSATQTLTFEGGTK
jgi:hypothetical protein